MVADDLLDAPGQCGREVELDAEVAEKSRPTIAGNDLRLPTSGLSGQEPAGSVLLLCGPSALAADVHDSTLQ